MVSCKASQPSALGKMQQQQHVVAVPYPAQGHINPMLQLCRQLAPFGFTFTFIISHHIHQRVQRSRSSSNSGHGVHLADTAFEHPDFDTRSAATTLGQFGTHGQPSSIRMAFVPGGCAPEGHARQSTWGNVFKAAEDMQQHAEQLLSQIMQERAVTFLLSDVLLSWSVSTARKFRLPWLAFWPASAASCSTFLYFADLATEGKSVPIADKETGEAGSATIEDIPGLPPTRLCELHKVWDASSGKVEHPILRSFQQVAAKETSCLVMNTFEELEGQVLEALRKRLPSIAVGPLLPSHYFQLPNASGAARGPEDGDLSLFPQDQTCLVWLDTQAPSSVLFISFGSISLRTERQLKELALGVNASGCPFLWVRRPPPRQTCPDHASLDEEEDGNWGNNGGKGLIVPWAPQLQVLSHPSVGGFMTHCGWNSVMESVAMGVPMVCWADTGERMSNARFVVEHWKCGIHMVAGNKRLKQHIDEAELVGRTEVENSVRQLMFEEIGSIIRARAAQLRAISKDAFANVADRFREIVEATQLQCPTYACS